MRASNHSLILRKLSWGKSFLAALFLIGILLAVIIFWLNQESSRVFQPGLKALITLVFAYLAILFFHGTRRKTDRSNTERGAPASMSVRLNYRLIAPALFAAATLVATYELITKSDYSASGFLGFLAFLSLGFWAKTETGTDFKNPATSCHGGEPESRQVASRGHLDAGIFDAGGHEQ